MISIVRFKIRIKTYQNNQFAKVKPYNVYFLSIPWCLIERTSLTSFWPLFMRIERKRSVLISYTTNMFSVFIKNSILILFGFVVNFHTVSQNFDSFGVNKASP